MKDRDFNPLALFRWNLRNFWSHLVVSLSAWNCRQIFNHLKRREIRIHFTSTNRCDHRITSSYFLLQSFCCAVILQKGHSYSKYAKFSEKLTFLTPCYAVLKMLLRKVCRGMSLCWIFEKSVAEQFLRFLLVALPVNWVNPWMLNSSFKQKLAGNTF